MEYRELENFTGHGSRGWVCDTCGQTIAKGIDGYVQWITLEVDGETKGRDLTIVHHVPASPRKSKNRPYGCQFDEKAELAKDEGIVSDSDLPSFLGPDGLMRLLIMLTEGELPPKTILEVIKRLHIPGYERVRLHFRRAIAEGLFEPNTPEGFYWQSEIQAVLDWAKEEPGEED